ncbi:unnamed protein product [Ranitomeya imitator]|uniref:Uncharacterized protein n=1 Tax=Ranitomeya imitator TaxID=111125 RepID=A0ABN9M4F4_9NEOB|nr:unnamed protein product [Ranitomeya imitator]
MGAGISRDEISALKISSPEIPAAIFPELVILERMEELPGGSGLSQNVARAPRSTGAFSITRAAADNPGSGGGRQRRQAVAAADTPSSQPVMALSTSVIAQAPISGAATRTHIQRSVHRYRRDGTLTLRIGAIAHAPAAPRISGHMTVLNAVIHYTLFTDVTQVCVGLLHFTTNACPPYLDKETWTRTLYLTRPSIYRSKWGVQYYNCEPAFVCACDHIYDTAQLFFLFPPGHFKKILEGYYLTLGPDYTYRTVTGFLQAGLKGLAVWWQAFAILLVCDIVIKATKLAETSIFA